MRQYLRPSWLLAGLVVLAACGIPSDDEPQVVPVPKDWYPVTAQEVGDDIDSTGDEFGSYVVYLLNGDQVERRLRELPSGATVKQVVESLLGPATAEDLEAGLESAIPGTTRVISVTVEDDTGVITMNLNAAFYDRIEGIQSIRATAQLVFTGLELIEGATGVLFQETGEFQILQDGNGDRPTVPADETPPPLTRADFAQFDPEILTTTEQTEAEPSL